MKGMYLHSFINNVKLIVRKFLYFFELHIPLMGVNMNFLEQSSINE